MCDCFVIILKMAKESKAIFWLDISKYERTRTNKNSFSNIFLLVFCFWEYFYVEISILQKTRRIGFIRPPVRIIVKVVNIWSISKSRIAFLFKFVLSVKCEYSQTWANDYQPMTTTFLGSLFQLSYPNISSQQRPQWPQF